MLKKGQLGQGKDIKKYIIHSLVLKLLHLFSNRGEMIQAQRILSQSRKCQWHKVSQIDYIGNSLRFYRQEILILSRKAVKTFGKGGL